MAKLCKEMSWRDVVGEMRERYGLELAKSHVQNFKGAHGIKRGTNPGCFKKGNVPQNKGRSWSEWMPEESRERCKATFFRKGEIRGAAAERLQDVDHESVREDGLVWVKVDDHRATSAADRNHRWKQRSHVVWERAHGPLPEGWNVVHLDHDPPKRRAREPRSGAQEAHEHDQSPRLRLPRR